MFASGNNAKAARPPRPPTAAARVPPSPRWGEGISALRSNAIALPCGGRVGWGCAERIKNHAYERLDIRNQATVTEADDTLGPHLKSARPRATVLPATQSPKLFATPSLVSALPPP